MTTQQKEINWDLLSNLRCYLAPNNHRRKTKSDNDSLEICADSGASSCETPDEIDFIPGTYKILTIVTINGISEGLKFSGCRSVSWTFQDDKKENIEIIIELVLYIPSLPIRFISHNRLQNKQEKMVMPCMQKRTKLV